MEAVLSEDYCTKHEAMYRKCDTVFSKSTMNADYSGHLGTSLKWPQ